MESDMRRQGGQAATEFLIAAVFLVVPLFLIVPLLGKYIDIKHAAIGQARYSAWEYTVWRQNDTSLLFGNPHDENFGKKNGAKVALNPLWRDHKGSPLLQLNSDYVAIKDGHPPAPFGIIGSVFEGLIDFVGGLFSMLEKVGIKGFDIFSKHQKGYYTVTMQPTVKSLDQALPLWSLQGASQQADDRLNPAGNKLAIKAKAAILTDGWNAGSPKMADDESKGLVITSLLSPITSRVDYLIDRTNRLLSHIPGFDIKLPGAPHFGYGGKDDHLLIPYEHLYDNPMRLQDKHGLSSYEQQ